MKTIVDYLEHFAAEQPDQCLYSFLDVDGREREAYTYLAFHERTRHLAETLSKQCGLQRGDRVMLVYPPGLEVIAAFVACTRIGVIPVPIYPPTTTNLASGLEKLSFIAQDCQPKVALTTRSYYRSYRLLLAKRRFSFWSKRGPKVPDLNWTTTDDVRGVASPTFENDSDPVLFLQYTSGSTSDPKGVVVSHENVIHNGLGVMERRATCVSWLPQYHDMGLIGYYLNPLLNGGSTHGFSPMDFLKRPALWLQTMSRVRATYSSSPNFGFEYCLREDKVSDDDLEGLDLSSLRVLMNAAEPVRAETFTRFFERFSRYGLPQEAHTVAFGLAENTLAVTSRGRQIVTVNKKLLQERKLQLQNGGPRNNNQLQLVSCGKPLDGVRVRIVEPTSHVAVRDGKIGEVWLAGPSKCGGYWNRPELTREVFEAAIAGESDEETYVRTGDLGFLHEGELFLCGRIKDLIIIRGANYYPQDIERIVELTSSKVRKGGTAAFAVEADGERLVVVAEARNPKDPPDPIMIARAIRTQYHIEPHTIVLVPPRTVAKTTSGKIARGLTRELWLTGALPALATHVSTLESQHVAEPTGCRKRFQYVLELYNLTGNEDFTFADVGLDSLMLAQLIDDTKLLLEERGVGALVDEVDLKLLQSLTISDFFSLLDQLDEGPDVPRAMLRRILKRVHEEREVYERDCMRSDAHLGPLGQGAIAASGAAVTDILLTGVTGYFGPFLLESLLRQTSYTIHALTRASDPTHGLDRIRSALRKVSLLTPEVEEQLASRVRVVCGDLARHNLGLRAEQWQELTRSTQAVVHNGALVNYLMSYDAMRPANVDGTREALRFAAAGVQKQFHLISSTFIFGWTVKDVIGEEDNNAEMEKLDFGYPQSKWVAEQLVLAAERQGLPVRIYRPAFLSASTTGIGSADDIMIRMMTFMINHGIAVNARNQVSFTPADIAADNIVRLIDNSTLTDRTFHLTADNYYSFVDIMQLVTRNYGYTFDYYDIPEFVVEMNRRCTRDDLLYPLVDFFTRAQQKIAAMQEKLYGNDRYRQARDTVVNGRPDPSVEQTVTYQMEFLLREGLIPRSPHLKLQQPSVSAVSAPEDMIA